MCLEGAYVGPVLIVSREGTREGCVFVVVPIRFSVGVRHALIAPQSYDVRVNVYTYSKPPSNPHWPAWKGRP